MATSSGNRQGSASAPAVPERTLGVDAEEPPPYTPNADVYQGETTVQYGPSRPNGPVPPLPQPQTQTYAPAPVNPVPTGFPPNTTGGSGRSGTGSLGSFWNQLREQVQVIADNVSSESRTRSNGTPYGAVRPQRTGGSSWSASPGNAPHAASVPPPAMPPRPGVPPPPPRHPGSMMSRSHTHLPSTASTPTPPRQASSEFARDFYAAGGDVDVELISPGPSSASSPHPNANAHGKPTNEPLAGHPLLNEGKLLVYPKGYKCEKCHNTGYKIPALKPCKKCWPKYGKPFTGPLAYSYSSPNETNAENFQRPLPPNLRDAQSSPSTLANSLWAPISAAALSPSPRPPPPIPPRPTYPSYSTSSLPRSGYGGYGGRPFHSGYGTPPGSRVFAAGDPRIGGNRCWRCNGSGTISLFLIDREQCTVCRGLGRTFN